ncbi:NAD(P)H-dependent oxidoreductase [Spirosoma lituiforme]
MALLILGHPNYKHSLANKNIVEQLQTSGLAIEVRNVNQLYPDYHIDAVAEQRALLRHQTIIFQYPFYWYNMPAVLKHWFDVVFTPGFAYGQGGDHLKGKNFMASFTIGGPPESYTPLGKNHFRIYEYCRNLEQTAYYAQMNYIEPLYMYGTSLHAGYTAEEITSQAKKHAQTLIKRLTELAWKESQPSIFSESLPVGD